MKWRTSPLSGEPDPQQLTHWLPKKITFLILQGLVPTLPKPPSTLPLGFSFSTPSSAEPCASCSPHYIVTRGAERAPLRDPGSEPGFSPGRLSLAAR
jgi:hypothetical protein